MRILSALGRLMSRRLLALGLVVMVILSSAVLVFEQQSYAAPNRDTASEAAIDRAYEFSEDAGIQEEIYQQRLREGQNARDLPKPYKRVEGANHREVPKTSLIEDATTKVKNLLDNSSDR